MKKLFLLILLASPFMIRAQRYEIPMEDLKNANFDKYQDNSIDIQKNGEKAKDDAKIIFTGITKVEAQLIEVKENGNNVNLITGEYDSVKNEKVFDLKETIESKFKFDVFYNEEKKGTVRFEVTKKDGEKVKTDKKKDGDGDEGGDEDEKKIEGYLGALTSANFVGNNKFLANLTPIVNLGGTVKLVDCKKFSWELDVNPYVGSDIDTKDSVSFVPALMLYGKAGLILNNYLHFDIGKTRITLMPFGLGLKFLPNMKDTNSTIIQHNIRAGLALKYSNVFVLSAQVTQGWHNITSESEKTFSKIFGNETTDISYITVIGQFALKGKSENITNYLFVEWRKLLSKDHFSAFTNNAILTLGIRKTLELSGGGIFPASTGKTTANRKGGKKVHLNL